MALVGGGSDGVLGPVPRLIRALVVRGRFRPVAATTRPAVTAALVDLAAAGALTPQIEATWPMSRARAALASAQAGHTVGKVVVLAG